MHSGWHGKYSTLECFVLGNIITSFYWSIEMHKLVGYNCSVENSAHNNRWENSEKLHERRGGISGEKGHLFSYSTYNPVNFSTVNILRALLPRCFFSLFISYALFRLFVLSTIFTFSCIHAKLLWPLNSNLNELHFILYVCFARFHFHHRPWDQQTI